MHPNHPSPACPCPDCQADLDDRRHDRGGPPPPAWRDPAVWVARCIGAQGAPYNGAPREIDAEPEKKSSLPV